MTTPESGSSSGVDLREIWPFEAYDFTPWLAKNLDLLCKAVGTELTLKQQEAPGWSGFLDILAETSSGANVAIENQLEDSDSDHFARLIGYAADHDAHVLVWVAPRFWEYHLKQVAWLNEMMAGKGEIHAVAVRLVPDGDLRLVDSGETARGFRAELSRADKNGPEWAVLKDEVLSETSQRYRDFFQGLLGDLRRSGFTNADYVHTSNDQTFSSGFTGIDYHAGFWGGSRNPVFSIYLWIAAENPESNKAIFDEMHGRHQPAIESELAEVWWDRQDNQRMSSVGIAIPGSIEDSDERLGEIRVWASSNIPKFKAVMQPCLEQAICELQFGTQQSTE